ncbi:MAG: galactonate dehydratase [bacterium]|jgi:galactonate dehydratase
MKPNDSNPSRRSILKGTLGAAGFAAFFAGLPRQEAFSQAEPQVDPKDNLRITRLETFLVKPRWLFLKVHTNAGIVGLGEPITEGRALTCATAVKEIEPYLVGQDPRRVVHHWQAIYRHAFYRGGPILTSALSGIDMALWDIKGKALGVPVYELLGGPTRDRIRVYARAGSPEQLKQNREKGFHTFKTGVHKDHPSRIVENKAFVDKAVEHFASLREAGGDEVDIAIDYHGAIPPQTSKLLIKGMEPYQPFFIEEPVQCQYVEEMANIARGTHLPIATGERIFTKWGFRDILEQGAASILQPDLCHAGGITEVRIIAGMAEAYYAAIAPHNPLGPISLAAGIQLAASIPNFLCQEQVSLGEGYLKEPFEVVDGYIPLPTRPGLGIELDDDALVDKIDHDWRNPETYDAFDGSVVDW